MDNINPKIELEEQADSPTEGNLFNQIEQQDLPVINIVLNPDQSISSNALNIQVPLFIKKIWKIVNDPSSDDIISWTEDGQGFIIHDQLRFISETLPKYFKHNQMSSFVRQLNLYDFHKVQHVERDECHFTQPFFQKDIPELLPLIKRKTQTSRPKAPKTSNNQAQSTQQQQQQNQQSEVQKLLTTLNEIKSKSDTISTEMSKLRQENAALWREMNSLRLKYSKQTKIINKLIHFLLAYVQKHHNVRNNRGGRTVSASNANKYLKTGPKIMELDYKYRNDPHEFWSEFDNTQDKDGTENVAYTVVEPESINDNEGPQSRKSPLPNMQVSSAIEEILSPSGNQNLNNQSPQNRSQFDYATSIPSTSKTPSNGALQRARSQDSIAYLIDNSKIERNHVKELLMNLTPEDMTNFYKLVNDNYKLQEDDLMFDAEAGLDSIKDPTESAQVDLDDIINNSKTDSLDSQLTEEVLNDIIQAQNVQPEIVDNNVTSTNNLSEPNIDPSSLGLGTDDLLNTDYLLNNVSVDQYFSID